MSAVPSVTVKGIGLELVLKQPEKRPDFNTLWDAVAGFLKNPAADQPKKDEFELRFQPQKEQEWKNANPVWRFVESLVIYFNTGLAKLLGKFGKMVEDGVSKAREASIVEPFVNAADSALASIEKAFGGEQEPPASPPEQGASPSPNGDGGSGETPPPGSGDGSAPASGDAQSPGAGEQSKGRGGRRKPTDGNS